MGLVSQAPERITNQLYGFPADIWSLGMTVLAVVFGKYPLGLGDGGYWDLLELICDKDIPLPDTSRFSPGFVDLLRCCLQKDPVERITLRRLRQHEFFTGLYALPPDGIDEKTSDCLLATKEVCISPESTHAQDDSWPSPRMSPHVRKTWAVMQWKKSTLLQHDGEDGDLRMRALRREHLSQVLAMAEEKLQHYECGRSCCSLSRSNVSSGQNSHSSTNSPWNSMRRVPSRKYQQLPNFEKRQWLHLANQFHLPLATVIEAARDILSPEFISPSSE